MSKINKTFGIYFELSFVVTLSKMSNVSLTNRGYIGEKKRWVKFANLEDVGERSASGRGLANVFSTGKHSLYHVYLS